jgi:hypothetical protein
MQTDRLASANTYAPSFSSPSATVTGHAPVTNGQAYTVRKWNDTAGNEVQEYWTVTGMPHAWSGATSGSYPDATGPSATQNIYAFLTAHALSGPPTPATAPPAPTGLSASASSPSQIDLSWTGSSQATGYQVQRSPDGSTGWTQIGAPSTTSYSDLGLAQSTVYYYQVLATNSIGPSGPSSVASARTQLAVSQAPQGTWVGTYGKDGYALLAWNGTSGDLVSLKPATLTLDQATRWTWRTSSTLAQDLQSPDAATRRATCVFDNNQLRLHLTFTTAYTGTLHLYALDASTTARREVITVNDGNGPQVANLNSSFNLGAWVSPAINVPAGGTVTITIDHLAGYNAVLSGLFLG